MADKQDVGVKISQPGYNARTALDYNLIFSSSWPQLSIVKEFTSATVSPTNFGGTSWGYPNTTFTHNLGFFAFAMTWVKGMPGTQGNISGSTTNISHAVYRPTIYIDKVVWTSGVFSSSTTPPNITIHCKVYNLDITKPVTYPYKQPPVIKMPYDKDYGIKLSKENKNISSSDMRDFIIHSRCQSPQVDSVIVGASNVSTITYQTNNSYVNWVFAYGGFASGSTMSYVPAPVDQTQSTPWLRVNRDSSGNVVQGDYSVTGVTNAINMPSTSIVVLRDPLLVANEIQVVY